MPDPCGRCLLATALLLFAGAPATADPVLPGLFAVTGVAAGDVLNVRDVPGTEGAVIASLPADAREVEVVARDPGGAWGRVNAGEGSGWVALRYLAAQPDVWRPGALPATLACFGTEPFWSVRFASGEVELATPEGPPLRLPLLATRDTGIPEDERRAALAGDGPERLTAFIEPGECSDGMSDRAFGLTAAVLHERGADVRLLTGCCSIAP